MLQYQVTLTCQYQENSTLPIYLNRLSNIYWFFIGKNFVFLKIVSKFYKSVVGLFAVMMYFSRF